MNVLVVSPHPDDETLGAGGTLLKLKKQGHNIFWLNITDMKLEYGWDKTIVDARQKQLKMIKEYYGFSNFYNLELPPTKLSSLDEGMIISKIKDVFEYVKPELLIIPGAYDAHSDHAVVYNCCMACSKTFRAPYLKRIITMEIVSETDFGYQTEKFRPNFFVDISDEITMKLDAARIYETEIEKPPFPRSLENIKALATLRGAGSFSMYAEAFYIVKQIE